MELFTSIIHQTSAIIVLSYFYSLVVKYFKNKTRMLHRIIYGICFAVIAVGGMLFPVELPGGISFDVQLIIIFTASVFGGAIPGGICGVFVFIYYYAAGGADVAPEITVILTAFAAGLIFKYILKNKLPDINPVFFLVPGPVLALSVFCRHLLFTGGQDAFLQLQKSFVPAVLLYTGAAFFVGMLFIYVYRRENIEFALNEEKEKYKRIFNSIEEGYLLTGLGGQILSANPKAAKILEYNTAEELAGENILNLYETPGNRERIISLLLENRQLKNYTAFFLKKKKKKIAVECNLNLLDDDKSKAYAIEGTFRDVTERNKMDEELGKYRAHLEDLVEDRARELKASEERFKAIFEQAAVGVGIVDSNSGKFLKINQAYCSIVGYTEEDMLNTDYMSITHEEDIHLGESSMSKLIEGKIDSFSIEKRYYRKNRSISPASRYFPLQRKLTESGCGTNLI